MRFCLVYKHLPLTKNKNYIIYICVMRHGHERACVEALRYIFYTQSLTLMNTYYTNITHLHYPLEKHIENCLC